MSIKYNSVADIPDSLLSQTKAKLAGEEPTKWTEYYTCEEILAAKECLARCEGEWDGEVLNKKFGDSAEWEKYKMLYNGEFCIVYKSESHIECAGRVDTCEFRPIKTAIARKENERIKQLESLVESYKAKYYEALDEVKRLESELPKLKGVRMENRRLIKANKKLVAKLKGGKGGKGWPE